MPNKYEREGLKLVEGLEHFGAGDMKKHYNQNHSYEHYYRDVI